ncbi:MAG: serine/threonine protein kinase, partial [Phycisphaerales bacterium]|nr:serine/threonine protein kinase [Phycisphaerales bacterium]
MNQTIDHQTKAGRDHALIEAAADDARQIFAAMPTAHEPIGPSFTGTPPDSLAGYELVRELHRGGQGVVYQAIQKTTRRKVAIKVMREGPLADARDKARFEREVQILGQLQHPNIVAIHDSGTAGGCFFYAMDYISGQPLDAFMASGQLAIDQTLRLFAKICEAVNAAHLRGVIHRDLKPSNIIVDSNGEPHILDFGLAKVATGQMTGEERPQIMTVTGQFVGSLPFASPEQAEGSPIKIDIRSDVYSLGVILYQMLTGCFPYVVVGNMRDVLENILNAQPIRPSTLRRHINNEVETIILKCLSKQRERRYQSAGELGRDIGRYLEGQPIQAKRDSVWYVLHKAMARRKWPIAAAVALTLIAGLSYAAWARNRTLAEQTRWQNVVAVVKADWGHDGAGVQQLY